VILPRDPLIYVAKGTVDLRFGFDKLAGVVTAHFGKNPRDGALYVFLNKARNRLKILFFDASGAWLLHNQPSSHYTSSDTIRASRVCRRRLDGGRSVDEPIPSTALLDWRIRPRILVEPRVAVGSMRANDAVLSPSDDGMFVNAETRRHLPLCEHASISESIVP